MTTPTKLERPPIVESVFEVRFAPAAGGSIELLPGLMFGRLSPWFTKAENTPLAGVPAHLREQHPELSYAAEVQLQGPDRILQLGARVATLSAVNYPGWPGFKADCLKTAQELRETGRIETVERFSLKYVNLLDHSKGETGLSTLKIDLAVPGRELSPDGFRLRFEVLESRLRTIIECTGGATAKTSGRFGLMFTIDTIRQTELERFWDDLPVMLEETHETVRGFFFGLLSSQSLESFGPVRSAT